MPSQPQQPTANQTISPFAPIDPTPIVEHGESPTAIILAIAILISILVGSITGLLRVLALAILLHSKPSR